MMRKTNDKSGFDASNSAREERPPQRARRVQVALGAANRGALRALVVVVPSAQMTAARHGRGSNRHGWHRRHQGRDGVKRLGRPFGQRTSMGWPGGQ